MRYCGREFSEEEIKWICRMIEETGIHRSGLSRKFCDEFNWRKPDGGLKEMSCRVAFLRMERDGIIKLPPRVKPGGKPRKHKQRTIFTVAQPEINGSAGDLADLHLEIVEKQTSALWNEFIEAYHYLGYKPLPGAQIRYFIKSGEKILGLFGFGAAAWSMESRDKYIAWSAERRKENLYFIVNNARFLILPWVRIKNLASRTLSMVSKRLADDWEARYNYRPVLLETCVEKRRFIGTSYKAANWICVGDTKGRGKLDRDKEYKVSVKSVWLYPLRRNYRKILRGEKA